jgi:hypothetical protein
MCFSVMMLDAVHGDVDDTNIVTKQNRSTSRWPMKLVEELMNPTSLGNGTSHIMVLSLGIGTGDRVLPLRRATRLSPR